MSTASNPDYLITSFCNFFLKCWIYWSLSLRKSRKATLTRLREVFVFCILSSGKYLEFFPFPHRLPNFNSNWVFMDYKNSIVVGGGERKTSQIIYRAWTIRHLAWTSFFWRYSQVQKIYSSLWETHIKWKKIASVSNVSSTTVSHLLVFIISLTRWPLICYSFMSNTIRRSELIVNSTRNTPAENCSEIGMETVRCEITLNASQSWQNCNALLPLKFYINTP